MANSDRGKRVRDRRERRGVTQMELAEAAGISRQTLSSIEAGRSEPSVSIALRIAAALDQRVEDLFGQGAVAEQRVEAELVAATEGSGRPQRVALALLRGGWLAHPLGPCGIDASRAASGLLVSKATRSTSKVQIELLQPLASARDTVLIAGCAPALGVLAHKLNDERGPGRFVWLERSNSAALAALRAGHVHVAGVHLPSAGTAQVRRVVPEGELALVTLAGWHAGLLLPRGNPRRMKGAADLGRGRLRIAARERGAGARALLERTLQAHGVTSRALLERAPTFRGHLEVAQAIAMGAADVGVAIESAALAYGLDFLPLAQERFDLVTPREMLGDPRLARLFEMLTSAAWRRELTALGGYDAAQCGMTAA